MNSMIDRKKSISLIFRGFDLTSQEVALLVGVAASRLGNRGESVKPGVKTVLTRSYVGFSMDFQNDYLLVDMIPALLAYLGGIHHLCRIRNQIQPEFFEIDFDLPVRKSDEPQEGFLPQAVIADVFVLRASLSFGFF
jgi:hypothetical protein